MAEDRVRALVIDNDQGQQAALSELAASAAHRLTNLLAVVLGRVEILLRCLDSAPARGHLQVVKDSAVTAAQVARWVSRLAQVRGAERHMVDVSQVATEALEQTRARWKQATLGSGRPIEVVRQTRSIGPVMANPAALREVVASLLLNAMEAMPDGGQVYLRTFQFESRVCLAVADLGVGMSDDVRQRACEPFFTTKGVGRAGLGLTVASELVRAHGGELEIETTEGRGTTVTVRLPDCSVPEPERPAPESTPISVDLPPLRVLVIDDDDAVRLVLAEMLVLDGHHVLQAANGWDGLAILSGGEPVDLVVTDLGMPEITGWGVARAIKLRWPQLPVVFMTGLEGLDGALLAGEARLLTKPVTAETLRQVVDGVRATAVRPEAATPAPVAVDVPAAGSGPDPVLLDC